MKKFLFVLFIGLLTNSVSAFDHSHSSFNSLLRKYVNGYGRVNYSGFKGNSSFNSYLKKLSAVSYGQYNGFSKQKKIAFLINAYNAFTIKLIVDNYKDGKPVKSIKKITNRPWAWTPWKIKFFKLLGKKRNLDWIEHSMLRVKFKEPRIHFAIVCASIGCPKLANSAYKAASLESQLQRGLKRFLSNRYRNKYDSSKKVLKLSPIFKWFKKDFGGSDAAVIKFVDKVMQKNIPSNTKIKYTYYNWNLNKQK
ncbi:MAG: DUF547 domain-containing protein [Spirochaetota bacterium]